MLRTAPEFELPTLRNERPARNVSQRTPRSRISYLPFKTALEKALSATLLILTAPLIGAMAVLTCLTSPGPAFYGQVRLGKDGRPFTMWKIRSMKHNCEAKSGAVWAAAEDCRVTRIGQFLRETHLDELPQLWNVLKGEMSLIGPRPERPEIVTRLENTLPRYRERLRLRPGITGLAQLQRPADRDVQDVRWKLAYDLYYQKNLGPGLDLRIALCTVLHMVGVTLNCAGKLLVKSCRLAVEGERPELAVQPISQQRNPAGAPEMA